MRGGLMRERGREIPKDMNRLERSEISPDMIQNLDDFSKLIFELQKKQWTFFSISHYAFLGF